jgi:hypothetical protein
MKDRGFLRFFTDTAFKLSEKMIKNILTGHIRIIVEKNRQMVQSYKTAQEYIQMRVTDSNQ